MILFILRHGIAGPTPPGKTDRDRQLTDEGMRLLQDQVAFLKSFGTALDAVFSSPYRRAVETAEIVAPAFGRSPETASQLLPGCSLEDVAELVSSRPGVQRCMIVGHQPDLGHVVYVLTGARAAMRPGMLAVIETPVLRPSAGTLHGLYDPDLMAGRASPS